MKALQASYAAPERPEEQPAGTVHRFVPKKLFEWWETEALSRLLSLVE